MSMNQNWHKQQDCNSLHFAYSICLRHGLNKPLLGITGFLPIKSRAPAGSLSSSSALRNNVGVGKSNFLNV